MRKRYICGEEIDFSLLDGVGEEEQDECTEKQDTSRQQFLLFC
ncbi:hypothetical protein [Candidatus Alkanophaga liquidiphilum]|nr:hypothetical protein [Candidatus Alkanophaga liquidiphilum]